MADPKSRFVAWFRGASPYIHGHRGQSFVICFDGEAVLDKKAFANLIHDIALLSSLGVRLIVVHGARPQIEERLRRAGLTMRYENELRVTAEPALACVKEAVGAVRVEIEALFSTGFANSPMAGAGIRVVSGNFVIARPLGVRDGVDYGHTGEVRRVDCEAISARLDNGEIVLISPLGYSPTGEVFNLSAFQVAGAVAAKLDAAKLVLLIDAQGVVDVKRGLQEQLTVAEAEGYLGNRASLCDPDHVLSALRCAAQACRANVRRVHLIDRRIDGALLLELFTRDGIGTLISAAPFDEMRKATIEDIAGIFEVIAPLEEEGVLVRRSRETLELEIDRFTLLVRDGTVIGCAALYPYPEQSVAEVACLAVHPDYRNAGRASQLFDSLTRQAVREGVTQMFVLTTQAGHWFSERGFEEARLEDLPVARKALYNYQRNSKVFVKHLSG